MGYFITIAFQMFHAIFGFLGVFLNSLLLYISLFYSPPWIKTYSILIINFALTDLLAAASSAFLEARLIPVGVTLAQISYGPCSYLGPVWCYAGYGVMFHLYVFSQYSLALSFCYRYYILLKTAPRPMIIVFWLFVVYIPPFLQLFSFMFNRDDSQQIYNVLEVNGLAEPDMTVSMITGNLNVADPTGMFPILHMTFSPIPIYITILIVRAKIVKMLNSMREHLREETKQLHRQLLKILSFQAALPIFFVIGVILFTIENNNIFRHPVLEFSISSVQTMIPILSPILYFYYVKPYRKKMANLLHLKNFRKSGNGKVGAVSVSGKSSFQVVNPI